LGSTAPECTRGCWLTLLIYLFGKRYICRCVFWYLCHCRYLLSADNHPTKGQTGTLVQAFLGRGPRGGLSGFLCGLSVPHAQGDPDPAQLSVKDNHSQVSLGVQGGGCFIALVLLWVATTPLSNSISLSFSKCRTMFLPDCSSSIFLRQWKMILRGLFWPTFRLLTWAFAGIYAELFLVTLAWGYSPRWRIGASSVASNHRVGSAWMISWSGSTLSLVLFVCFCQTCEAASRVLTWWRIACTSARRARSSHPTTVGPCLQLCLSRMKPDCLGGEVSPAIVLSWAIVWSQ